MRTLFPLVLLLLLATDLPAQHPALMNGLRVRISGCEKLAANHFRCLQRIEGTVVGKTPEDLFIRQQSDTGISRIPLVSIQTMRAQSGLKRMTVAGSAAGLFLGAALGGVLGKTLYPGEPPSPSATTCVNATMWLICVGDRGESSGIGKGALIGALIGTGVGAVIGTIVRTSRWDDISPDQVRVAPIVAPDGRFGLSGAVRF